MLFYVQKNKVSSNEDSVSVYAQYNQPALNTPF